MKFKKSNIKLTFVMFMFVSFILVMSFVFKGDSTTRYESDNTPSTYELRERAKEVYNRMTPQEREALIKKLGL